MSTPSQPSAEDIIEALQAANALRWTRRTYLAGEDVGDGTTAETDTEVVGPEPADMLADPRLAALVVLNDAGEPVGYDLSGLVGYLGKAVAELSTQVADLRRKVEAKPTAKYPWEPGWSPFPS